MFRIEDILDPVHKLPFRAGKAEDLVAFFELLRGLLEQHVPALFGRMPAQTGPSRIGQARQAGQNASGSEIKQKVFRLRVLHQNTGRYGRAIRGDGRPQDVRRGGNARVHPGKRPDDHVMVFNLDGS